MSITDVIKKSVLQKVTAGDLSTTTILVTLAIACFMGLFIYVVYRLTTKSGFYNRIFNRTLAVLPVITTGIMLAMQSNLVISLGMVGALSIVRFRNAVKDSSDLMFLFWSISMGIVVGAQLFELAILLSLCVTVMVFFLDFLPTLRQPCLLVISGETVSVEKDILACIQSQSKKVKIRSRNIRKNGVEWIFELQMRNETEMIEKLNQITNITSISIMTHDGEVRF